MGYFAVLAGLYLLPVAAFSGDFGDPKGFLDDEAISETVFYPGVTYIRADGGYGGLPMVTHVVRIDLSIPDVSMRSLLGERFVGAASGQFFRRSTVSQMQRDNGALAAINTAFFDIGTTQSPSGLVLDDGLLIRSPQSGRNSLAFSGEGKAFLTQYGWSGLIRKGISTHSLTAVNPPAVGSDNVALYLYPWDRSPGIGTAPTEGEEVTEAVVQLVSFEAASTESGRARLRGTVQEVRNDAGSVTLSKERFVLTATGVARDFLHQFSPGDEVEVSWQLTDNLTDWKWNEVREVISGGVALIWDGTKQSLGPSARHPRSAVGISEDGEQVMLVLVEGRQDGRAEGMSLASLRDYFHHMAAHSAMNLDGGGSSALAARIDGDDTLLSTPSAGTERYVPVGLGVFMEPEKPHGFFENIDVSVGPESALVSWETPEPATPSVRFGQFAYDRQVSLQDEMSRDHTVLLTALDRNTRYFLRLVAETPAQEWLSHGLSFTTLGELTINHPDAVFSGSWNIGTSGVPYKENYRWTETTTGIPTHTATYTPNLSARGLYDIHVWYVPHPNRTTHATYHLTHDGGTETVHIDQTRGGNGWEVLAEGKRFSPETEGRVRITNADDIGGRVVVAEAFRWIFVEPDPLPVGQVPVWWKRHFFGDVEIDPLVDYDGDGYTVFEEYLWGTSPNDSRSRLRFRLEPDSQTVGAYRFIVSPYHAGRDYRLDQRTHFREGTWEPLSIPPRINAHGEMIFDIPPMPLPTMFFQLRARLPE